MLLEGKKKNLVGATRSGLHNLDMQHGSKEKYNGIQTFADQMWQLYLATVLNYNGVKKTRPRSVTNPHIYNCHRDCHLGTLHLVCICNSYTICILHN